MPIKECLPPYKSSFGRNVFLLGPAAGFPPQTPREHWKVTILDNFLLHTNDNLFTIFFPGKSSAVDGQDWAPVNDVKEVLDNSNLLVHHLHHALGDLEKQIELPTL